MAKRAKYGCANDVTIKMINERALANWPSEVRISESPETIDMWNSHWNYHAQELHDEMLKEGLTQTAAAIKEMIK